MWQYTILKTGFFYADGGAMFGSIPKRAWQRKYPCNEENGCILSMNCLLIWNDRKVILLDTGVGNEDLSKYSYYRFYGVRNIADLVCGQGFQPKEITDVVLSHLHFDHCGGCTYRDSNGNLKITFPNALYYVGKMQWENYICPNLLEKNSFAQSNMFLIEKSGLLQLVEKDLELYQGFRLKLCNGHSYGQLVSMLELQNRQILFPGDVIPTKAHFSNEWISAYDVYPLKSLEDKIAIKKEIENKNVDIAFYHDAYHPFVDSSALQK